MADRYWVWGTGNWDASTTTHWSASSGGAGGASVPTSADNVIFDQSSSAANAAYTVTITATANCLDFTMDGPHPTDVNKVTWEGSSALNIYGSLNLLWGTAGITRTYSGVFNFLSNSTWKTISTNWVAIASNFVFNNATGWWTLLNSLTSANTVIVTAWNFNSWNYDITCNSFSSSNSNTRTISLWSSVLTCTQLSAALAINFATVTGLTFNAWTSTVKITSGVSWTVTFSWGGLTFNNFWNASTWNCVVLISWSNTFNQFKVDAWRTQQFTAGTTQTIADPVFVGTLGNVITIGSSTAASHTLAKSGGGTVTADYCSISRSTATPASTWYATNSTDGGNNSGWTFGAAPSWSNSNFLMFF